MATSSVNIRQWPALWSLVIGFFMILVDTTIVSVATPAIIKVLNADINQVLWVTSAYLLAYAVPLLVTGRLGDRFGPKNIYLIGLVVFTLSSLWCGLSTGVEMLIIARVVQGLGAALMTPQTMAVITRVFPPQQRGAAMGLWGAAAGVATLVGPLLGGILIDVAGWEWIFFINVPVGVIGFVLAWKFVPSLETHVRSFDWLGVFLSGAGMFCLVFGIQEGESFGWGEIVGPISVWSIIITGVVFLVLFVVWQAYNPKEPLVPLGLFKDRNFSLGNIAITAMGFSVTAMGFPLMLYAQTVREWGPTQSALILAPMAVVSGVLAPVVGSLINRMDPKYFAVAGFSLFSISLFWYSAVLTPGAEIWQLLLPSALMGLASSGIWGPVAMTATRNLKPAVAGAGSGVYNTTRQVGAVIGSAAIAALIQARLAANLPITGGPSQSAEAALPEVAKPGFSLAMSQSLILPAVVILIAVCASLFFAKPQKQTA